MPDSCSCGGSCRNKVAAAADAILAQCESFIREVPDSQYTRPAGTVTGGTIGKHARHVLDHFRAALCTPSCDAIDYDHRVRGGSVESSTRAACAEITALRGLLTRVTDERIDEPVTARVMLTGDGQLAELKSTLGRELFFATHHAIHHHAMMKTIGREFGIEAPAGFGTAPSTINFEAAR